MPLAAVAFARIMLPRCDRIIFFRVHLVELILGIIGISPYFGNTFHDFPFFLHIASYFPTISMFSLDLTMVVVWFL